MRRAASWRTVSGSSTAAAGAARRPHSSGVPRRRCPLEKADVARLRDLFSMASTQPPSCFAGEDVDPDDVALPLQGCFLNVDIGKAASNRLSAFRNPNALAAILAGGRLRRSTIDGRYRAVFLVGTYSPTQDCLTGLNTIELLPSEIDVGFHNAFAKEQCEQLVTSYTNRMVMSNHIHLCSKFPVHELSLTDRFARPVLLLHDRATKSYQYGDDPMTYLAVRLTAIPQDPSSPGTRRITQDDFLTGTLLTDVCAVMSSVITVPRLPIQRTLERATNEAGRDVQLKSSKALQQHFRDSLKSWVTGHPLHIVPMHDDEDAWSHLEPLECDAEQYCRFTEEADEHRHERKADDKYVYSTQSQAYHVLGSGCRGMLDLIRDGYPRYRESRPFFKRLCHVCRRRLSKRGEQISH
ncbi:unnamed protein product (mitochondrion) [Plasmodiophora brassicae]|uniref:Uncharacterized protein n=1 Tax=Plasmodiophora brassicae TaxID=37360 RepID=A0A0G4IVI2_PLABS|nr:hypothetical protein PBRA_001148 [Plasmodiophora brassicae]SPQ97251.1 unnamed protein product [Plasmodiophora brassicae]